MAAMGVKETEAQVYAASAKIDAKLEEAGSQIREALESARSEIEIVATDAAREMISRLTGHTVDQKEAAEAVRVELHV